MIKVILESINSKRDRAGNCYWAFRWINTESGRRVEATISGGESNITAVVTEANIDWKTVHYHSFELPIREFDRLTAGWGYAGCVPADILKYIQQKEVETSTTV